MEAQKVPVLFIIFNRPKLALQSFRTIKTYHPERIYIAADGPREGVKNDQKKCEETRELILEQIDWPCRVEKLFREENIGCGRGVSEAISWMFTQEEYGIIIEDDCNVSLDFFSMCEVLLPKYKQDERIAQINGFDLKKSSCSSDSYSFLSYPECWGWATWKRAWQNFDIEMKNWKSLRRKVFKRFSFQEACIHYFLWNRLYNTIISKKQKQNIWDFQWSIHIFLENRLCISPLANLVINTGFGKNSTNCGDIHSPLATAAWGHLKFPIQHPEKVEADAWREKEKSREYIKQYRGIFFRKMYNFLNNIKK